MSIRGLFLATLAFGAIADQSANVIDRRQVGAAGGGYEVVKTDADGVYQRKVVAPQLDKSAKREIIRLGPLKLGKFNGGASAHSGMHLDKNGDAFNAALPGICRDCMLLSGSTYLTYENGSVAGLREGVYNHHISVWIPTKSTKVPFSCAANRKNRRQIGAGVTQLFGSGHDGMPRLYMATDQRIKSGFYIGKNEKIYHSSEFVNYDKENTQEIYFTAEVEYLPGKPADYLDAMMGAVNANGCYGVMYYPKANSLTSTTASWKANVPGFIVNAQAHMHDGGARVILRKGSATGEVVCESKAEYGKKANPKYPQLDWSTIEHYSSCTNTIEVKKGDIFHVTAEYDTKAHPLRPEGGMLGSGGEAMGMMGYSFAPKKE